MKMTDVFPSRFLKAEDFAEDEVRILTIKGCAMEEVGQGKDKETKPVLSFRDSDKDLALNKTNFSIIAKALNLPDSDDWVGKRIALHVMEVEFKGEQTPAIRVKAKIPAAPVSSGVTGTGPNIPSKRRAVIQTPHWKDYVEDAVASGYVPDTSEQSGFRLLQVVGNAGIPFITDETLPVAWEAVVTHYGQLEPA